MAKYIKDNIEAYVGGKVEMNGAMFTGVTVEWLEAHGFTPVIITPQVEEYVPTEEEVAEAKHSQYHALVVEKIRDKYSADDEFAIQRQRYTNVDEFDEYNAYCEQCKVEAHKEVYGE